MDPQFLTLDDILFIHEKEIKSAGGEPNIRDLEGVKACVGTPKASFGGEYQMIFLEWRPHIFHVWRFGIPLWMVINEQPSLQH